MSTTDPETVAISRGRQQGGERGRFMGQERQFRSMRKKGKWAREYRSRDGCSEASRKKWEESSVGGVWEDVASAELLWLRLLGESNKGSWVSESKWAPEIITLWDIITSDSVIPAYWSVLTINWWHLNMPISWSRRKPGWFALVSAEALTLRPQHQIPTHLHSLCSCSWCFKVYVLCAV